VQKLSTKDVEEVKQKIMELLEDHSTSIEKSVSGEEFVVNGHVFKMREYMERGKSSKISLTFNGEVNRCAPKEEAVMSLLETFVDGSKDTDDDMVETPGGSKRKRTGDDELQYPAGATMPVSDMSTSITTLTTAGSSSAAVPSPLKTCIATVIQRLNDKIEQIESEVEEEEHNRVYKEVELANQEATNERISFLVSKQLAANPSCVSTVQSHTNDLRVKRDELQNAWDVALTALDSSSAAREE
jgi:hypothetical protein